MTAAVHVLGVRHHGPGSARAVATELDRIKPQVVLIEGPADATGQLALAAATGMSPPVALLAYAVDEPGRSAFWPFAVFSPEWQALTWALEHGRAVEFCDLPAAMVLAPGGGGAKARTGRSGPVEPDDEIMDDDEPAYRRPTRGAVRSDPLAALASAAGYDDPERWWDDVIESGRFGSARSSEGPSGQLSNQAGPFAALTEAMAELRLDATPGPVPEQRREARREAYMRTRLRAASAGGAQTVAVVCGAWHAPALTGPLPSAAADARVLRGTPRRKVGLTWVPWTHSRLAAASGYGAGVTSPGWYHHLFTQPDDPVTRWLTRVARVLRQEDLPVSSAHVIEAVRLADALATLRGRHLAGLAEVTDATRAVLVDGDERALTLVTARLVVGEALGTVPEGTATVPLEADLRAAARRLRLTFDASVRVLDLDLRRTGDRNRSRLLHRLALLGVPWGVPAQSAVRSTGTFRETWRLLWRPELSVGVIEAAMWGSTVEAAATARLADVAARNRATLPELTAAVESCLLADLPGALTHLLAALDRRAAVDVDLDHLTGALPALVRGLRYGDVRGTDTRALAGVVTALLTRVCVALPSAVSGLDDESAYRLRARIDAVHSAVALRDDPADRDRWLTALATAIDRPGGHGLLVGRMTRILRDAGRLAPAVTATRLARALSAASPAAAKAAWVEGFLAGGGLLLVHDQELLELLDGWVAGLADEEFTDVLPLLRRTFGQFAAGERRILGERVRSERSGPAGRPDPADPADPADAADPAGSGIDEERAAPVLAVVAALLGPVAGEGR